MDSDPEKPNPNRSPRAIPLPPVEWAPEVIPRDQRPSALKPPAPRVILGYPNAKKHFTRR